MSESKIDDSGKVEHIEHGKACPLNKDEPDAAIQEFRAREESMSTWQAVKSYKRIFIYAIVPFFGGMAYGYDTVASSATVAMPAFLMSFGAVNPVTHSLYAPSIWSALWTAMANLGQAIGAFSIGPLAERIGRRYAIVSCALLSCAGVAVQFTATTRWSLLIGKILNGVCIGGIMACGTTYAADIAPLKLRGPILQGLVLFTVAMQGTALGIIRAMVPNKAPVAWKIVFAIQWPVAVLLFLALLIPESPTWLLSQGKVDATRASLVRLYGQNNSIELRLQSLQMTLAAEASTQSQHKASFIECFQARNLKRTLTVCLMMFGTGLLGVAFLNQNTYIILTLGLPSAHAYDVGVGGFFLACVVIIVSWLFTDRIGHRRLWLIGVGGNVLGMATVGGLGFVNNHAGLWAIAVVMNLLIPWQIYTCTGMAWTMTPEIASSRLRQHTQSIGFLVQAVSSWLFHMIVPYMYNTDAGDLGAKTGFVFAGLSALLLGASWFVVPETAGRSVEEIDAAYEQGIPPRKFHKI
ncbi:putative MFS sugar transporter [Aspergillus uvarum CBS 121591]|uniref:Putative MFS sugar transporter n=1 Tax=Aspergillus uvarum CBS 121591 TaxID=1448315 RepID=A0A319DB54_9EURO|nr:putative MFS sugar transporter [Aspergillus uvarum CBS 121591]PYH85288.1 putative MFS sugar transporter [Aspergillus uvarum CBS 121591]